MTTAADIRKDYKKKIDAEEDETGKLRLELEMERAIGALATQEASSAKKDSWRKDAINKYKFAVLSEVDGETPEEIEAAAKASHERMDALISDRLEEQKAELERVKAENEQLKTQGKWASAGNGGGGAVDSQQERYDFIDGAWKAMREGTLNQQQANRLIETRVGDKVADAMMRALESH